MNDDQRLDKTLRRIPLPHDLESRLAPEVLFGDAAIDRLLASVVVPDGLADRLRAARHDSAGRPGNGAIDLSRYATDAFRGNQAGRLPAVRSARRERRMSLADLGRDIVSVATALGLVGVLTVAGIEFSRQLEGTPARPRTITRLDFGESFDATADDLPLRVAVPENLWGLPDAEAVPAIAAAPDVPRDQRPSGLTGDGGSPWPAVENRVADGAADAALGVDPLRPGMPLTVRGASVSSEADRRLVGPSALVSVEPPGVVRRRVPRVRGYDLAFEMTTGEQPFVDPAADPLLAVDRPPLSLGVDGFELLTTMDRRPLTRLRVEDILAAMPPMPLAPGPSGSAAPKLTIHEVRGLRSIAGMPTVLVEVAASAGSIRDSGRDAKPLTVSLVLDQSAAGNAAVWQRICRAVGDLATQLGPADRVSVVLAGAQPRLAIEAADRDRLAALASDLAWQGASGTSDLDAGLSLAPSADHVVLVAHATSLQTAGGAVRAALSAWHNALATVGGDSLTCEPTGGTRFIELDPATPRPSETTWREPTFGRTSPDAVAIRRALIRQVLRSDTLVASQCELEVHFDPRHVARYRLIGHRQSAVESLAHTPPRGTDLHAGETVRVVYEVIPRSRNRLGGLASAVLAWRTGAGHAMQAKAAPKSSTADLEPGVPSAHGCELLLATGVGELAAGSPHHGNRRPAVIASLERLVTAWRARGDMTAFGEVVARSLERRDGGGTAP